MATSKYIIGNKRYWAERHVGSCSIAKEVVDSVPDFIEALKAQNKRTTLLEARQNTKHKRIKDVLFVREKMVQNLHLAFYSGIDAIRHVVKVDVLYW